EELQVAFQDLRVDRRLQRLPPPTRLNRPLHERLRGRGRRARRIRYQRHVWEYGTAAHEVGGGVWVQSVVCRLPHSHTPTLPHSHTGRPAAPNLTKCEKDGEERDKRCHESIRRFGIGSTRRAPRSGIRQRTTSASSIPACCAATPSGRAVSCASPQARPVIMEAATPARRGMNSCAITTFDGCGSIRMKPPSASPARNQRPSSWNAATSGI